MTHPEQRPEHPALLLDETLYHEKELLKACVRSVVYHLNQALEKWQEEMIRVEFEDATKAEGPSWKPWKKSEKAKKLLLHCVERYKCLLAEGTFGRVAWIRVKQRNPDGFFNFRWIMVDDVLHLRFLDEFLPIECKRQDLLINREWLYHFE